MSEDIDTSKLFDSESEDESQNGICDKSLNVKSGRESHKLSVLKLRIGLSQNNLSEDLIFLEVWLIIFF